MFGGGGESRCYTSLLRGELAEEEGDKRCADMAPAAEKPKGLGLLSNILLG